jgi:hypothetical protein
MHNSQTANILAHLMDGMEITPIDALNLYGSMRLGARVYDLREAGYDIAVRVPKAGKRYAIYYMTREAIEKAKKLQRGAA